MATERMTKKGKGSFLVATMFGIAAAVGVWALVAFTFALSRVDWNAAEMLRQYMVAIGAIGQYDTLVNYYTHIKGVEYIIAVAFLGLFPAYYKYMNRTKATIKIR